MLDPSIMIRTDIGLTEKMILHYSGMKPADMAVAMGVSRATIYNALRRINGDRKLVKILETRQVQILESRIPDSRILKEEKGVPSSPSSPTPLSYPSLPPQKEETSLGVASPAPVVNVAPEKKKKPKAEKTDNQAYWDELLFMLLEYFHLEWGANHRSCNTWRSQKPTAATFVAFRRWRIEVTESMLRSGRSREMVDSVNTMLGSDAWKLDRPKLEAEAMRVAPEKIKQVEAEVAERLARKYPERFQTQTELIAK